VFTMWETGWSGVQIPAGPPLVIYCPLQGRWGRAWVTTV